MDTWPTNVYPKCLGIYFVFKLDGNHSFSIPEVEVKDIHYRRYKNNYAYKWTQFATVNVSVTEDLTGKTYFGTTKVVLRRTDVLLTFPEANPKSFKPNVPFQILVGCSVCKRGRRGGGGRERGEEEKKKERGKR